VQVIQAIHAILPLNIHSCSTSLLQQVCFDFLNQTWWAELNYLVVAQLPDGQLSYKTATCFMLALFFQSNLYLNGFSDHSKGVGARNVEAAEIFFSYRIP
jgi:hypothetical protein